MLQVLFVALKPCGVIAWPRAAALAPLWLMAFGKAAAFALLVILRS